MVARTLGLSGSLCDALTTRRGVPRVGPSTLVFNYDARTRESVGARSSAVLSLHIAVAGLM